MKYAIGLISVFIAAIHLLLPLANAQQPAPAVKPRVLSLDVKPWKGDFDQMLERRMIRVLVPYSRTLFISTMARSAG